MSILTFWWVSSNAQLPNYQHHLPYLAYFCVRHTGMESLPHFFSAGPKERNAVLISVSVFFLVQYIFKWNRQHRHSFLKDHFHSWRIFKKTAYNWQHSHCYFYQYDSIYFNHTSLELKWQIAPSGKYRTN